MMNGNEKIIRTADICDSHPETPVIQINFQDYAKKQQFHGIAVTYATFEDIRGLKELLSNNGRGKVLVVDGQGSTRCALCGGKIASQAFNSGWAGLIFNGVIRDQHEIVSLDFGVKAIGSNPKRPSQDGVGKLTNQVVISNVVIHSGDYIYADADGVIVLKNPVHN